MRTWIVALALLFMAAPVGAQDTSMDEFTDDDYKARIAWGDIPITPESETDGVWNLAEYFRFEHDGVDTTVTVPTEPVLSCTCINFTLLADGIQVGSDVAAGFYHVKYVHSLGVGESVSVELSDAPVGGSLIAYVPDGHTPLTNAAALGSLPCTGGAPCDIHTYEIGQNFWMTIQPSSAIIGAGPVDGGDGVNFLQVILAFLVGMVLWAFLVQRGYVQKRRKQEIQKAAHVEASEAEPKETLAARKRVIMAGLKDLEKAKMNKEIDDDSYASLKAELKKEAVVIMRALEAAE